MTIAKMLAGGAALLAAGVLAGCAGQSGDGRAGQGEATGTVHGTITLTGGPRTASPDSGAGTVVAKKGGRQVARQDVARGQQFSFQLPVGRYQLSIVGADAPCEAVTVTVVAGADQKAAFICSRK